MSATPFNGGSCWEDAGNIKNIVLTIVGAFAFGDFIYKFWNVVGLGVSMLGAIWYSTRLALKVCSPFSSGCYSYPFVVVETAKLRGEL